MKNHGIAVGLGLLALAVVLASATGINASARTFQQQPPKVGVVNLKECFDEKNCPRVKVLQADLNALKERVTKEIKDLDEELARLQSKLKDTPAGSPLFKKFRSELAELGYKRKAREELAKVELQEYTRKARSDLYDEICKAAEVIAKQKGLDLELKDDAPIAGDTEEERQQIPADMRIVYRSVLFYNPALDITKDVLAQLK